MNYVLPRSDLAFNRFGTSERMRQPKRIALSKLIALGNRYHRAGDLSRAETIFRIILEQNPDHPAALLSLGIIARQNRRYVAAAQLIERAVANAPTYHQAHNNLGTVYTDLGRIADSVECYLRAIELKGDYAEAYYNLGVAYQAQHKFDEALEAFSLMARTEGILPAIETSHAISWAMRSAARRSPDDIIVVCLSGRGDKDVNEVARLTGQEMG